jgi:hypothetical protein
MNEEAIEAIIAKVQLSAKIAQIALGCQACRETVKELIQKWQNRSSHQEGGHSLLSATNESSGVTNECFTSEYK